VERTLVRVAELLRSPRIIIPPKQDYCQSKRDGTLFEAFFEVSLISRIVIQNVMKRFKKLEILHFIKKDEIHVQTNLYQFQSFLNKILIL